VRNFKETSMKILANKTTELNGDVVGKKARYADLIVMVLNQPPQGGFSPDEMRKRFRIDDVLKGGGDEFRFEDADAKVLQACAKSMKWGHRHRDFVAFADDVAAMADAEPG
jgi:hypothetical protein